MDVRRRFIRRIELTHLGLAAVACALAASLAGPAVLTGVALGAALGGLNFRALAILAARFTRAGDNAARAGSAGLLIFKMVALMAAVGVVFVLIEPDGVGFIAGISLAPLALIVVSMIARPSFDAEPAGEAR